MSEKYLHEMIDDIEVLIDEAKPARFSPGKIMIEKDVLMTVIEELRKQIPGEIERSHKIILNKDAILEDARVKSQQMIDQAARDAGELIDQNEVVEMAKMRANEIETHAKDTARSVVHNANEEAGIDAYFPIVRSAVSLEDAMKKKNAQENLIDTVEQVFCVIKALK